MTGLEKLIEWLEGWKREHKGRSGLSLALFVIIKKARSLLLEEQKALEAKGDEGLREFVVRIVERAKYLGHIRVDLPVRILEKSLEMYPSHPMAEQKAPAPAGLVEELKALQKEIYALKIKERDGLANPETELNDRYHLGLSAGLGIASDRLKEVIASYRPAPSRTEELVKRVREWLDCRELYTLDYDGNPTVIDKGFATAQEEVGKILADFEKGTS